MCSSDLVFGFGIGNCKEWTKKVDRQAEFVTYNYHSSDFKNNYYPWSTHIKAGMVFNISPKLGIAVMTSLHFMFDENTKQESYKTSSMAVGGVSVGLVLR